MTAGGFWRVKNLSVVVLAGGRLHNATAGRAWVDMPNQMQKRAEQRREVLATAYSPTSSPMQYHLRSRA